MLKGTVIVRVCRCQSTTEWSRNRPRTRRKPSDTILDIHNISNKGGQMWKDTNQKRQHVGRIATCYFFFFFFRAVVYVCTGLNLDLIDARAHCAPFIVAVCAICLMWPFVSSVQSLNWQTRRVMLFQQTCHLFCSHRTPRAMHLCALCQQTFSKPANLTKHRSTFCGTCATVMTDMVFLKPTCFLTSQSHHRYS